MTKKSDWINALDLDEAISPEVKICGDRIDNSGVWWQASRNHNNTEVKSCKHAIKYRVRLGSGAYGGIPLWAELKTFLGVAVESSTGKKVLFAAHTRANTEFRVPLIMNVLGLDAEKATIQKIFDEDVPQEETELEANKAENKEFKLSASEYFGKINPFNIDLILSEGLGVHVGMENIFQVFDESLKLPGGFPDTVMSNLGDRRLAFEIHPDDLIAIIKKLSPNSTIAKIAAPCPVWLGLMGKEKKDYWLHFPPATGPKIGILTGNAPESGITLCQDILDSIRDKYKNLADVFMPEMHIHSLPQMGLSMELISRDEHVWEEVKGAVGTLLKIGCKIITLACNTTIFYEPRIRTLCEKNGARFVSIAEACMPKIKQELQKTNGETSVGLVGIGPVIDMEGPYSGYKRHLEAVGVNVSPCPGERVAFAVKSQGTEQAFVTGFRKLLNQNLAKEHVVVLALTEVSMLYREHIAPRMKKKKIPRPDRIFVEKTFIDSLFELGRYIAFLYLKNGYKESLVCQIPGDFKIDEKLAGLIA